MDDSIRTPFTSALAPGKLEMEDENANDQDNNSSSRHRRGLILAFFVGWFGGSILAPLNFVPPEQKGLVFVPSFGIGSFAMTSVILACVIYSNKRTNGSLEFKWSHGLPLGILSGTLFQLSNILSITAIPALGYGVVYPLLQCAILFSGFWGVFVFKEITGWQTVSIFFESETFGVKIRNNSKGKGLQATTCPLNDFHIHDITFCINNLTIIFPSLSFYRANALSLPQ